MSKIWKEMTKRYIGKEKQQYIQQIPLLEAKIKQQDEDIQRILKQQDEDKQRIFKQQDEYIRRIFKQQDEYLRRITSLEVKNNSQYEDILQYKILIEEKIKQQESETSNNEPDNSKN